MGVQMTLKIRFLEAVSGGDLGEFDDSGVIVTLKEFKSYFKDVKSDYVNSFLPAAVIEAGQKTATHTKFLFRVRKGVYRVHPDAMDAHIPDAVQKTVANPAVKAPTPVKAEEQPQEAPTLEVIKKIDDLDYPNIDSDKIEPRKKPNLDKMPASQMNNKVEEAMMQYMTYRLN